jgi:hypothetical protein
VPVDAGNILQVAFNRLLTSVRPKKVKGIFATQNALTASSLGSLSAESSQIAPVLTLEEWKFCVLNGIVKT